MSIHIAIEFDKVAQYLCLYYVQDLTVDLKFLEMDDLP